MLNRIYSGYYQREDDDMDMALECIKRQTNIDRTETCYGGKIGNYRMKTKDDTDSLISMPDRTKTMRKRNYF